jgi:hypothetical protein
LLHETTLSKPAPDCHRETVLKSCKLVGDFGIGAAMPVGQILRSQTF